MLICGLWVRGRVALRDQQLWAWTPPFRASLVTSRLSRAFRVAFFTPLACCWRTAAGDTAIFSTHQNIAGTGGMVALYHGQQALLCYQIHYVRRTACVFIAPDEITNFACAHRTKTRPLYAFMLARAHFPDGASSNNVTALLQQGVAITSAFADISGSGQRRDGLNILRLPSVTLRALITSISVSANTVSSGSVRCDTTAPYIHALRPRRTCRRWTLRHSGKHFDRRWRQTAYYHYRLCNLVGVAALFIRCRYCGTLQAS